MPETATPTDAAPRTYTPAERRTTSRRLSDLWTRAEYRLNNVSWTKYGTRLLALALAEANDARRGVPSVPGFGAKDEARLFALRRLCEYLRDADAGAPPEPLHEALHMQPSAVYACGIVHSFPDAVRRALADEDRAWVLSLDYAEIVP